jgi:hypothetical protein
MHHKIFRLTIMLMVFFSLQGFSQTTDTPADDKSDHPLLDKYYPQPKEKAPNKVTPPPATPSAVNPLPVTQVPAKPAPVLKPVVALKPEPVETQVVEIAPAPAIKAEGLPVQGSAPSMSSATVPVIANTPTVIPPVIPPVVDSVVTVIAPAPAPKPVAPPLLDKVPTPPVNRNRLGSSTKKYDTWEKNSNGAGSVTTSPKG